MAILDKIFSRSELSTVGPARLLFLRKKESVFEFKSLMLVVQETGLLSIASNPKGKKKCRTKNSCIPARWRLQRFKRWISIREGSHVHARDGAVLASAGRNKPPVLSSDPSPRRSPDRLGDFCVEIYSILKKRLSAAPLLRINPACSRLLVRSFLNISSFAASIAAVTVAARPTTRA